MMSRKRRYQGGGDDSDTPVGGNASTPPRSHGKSFQHRVKQGRKQGGNDEGSVASILLNMSGLLDENESSSKKSRRGAEQTKKRLPKKRQKIVRTRKTKTEGLTQSSKKSTRELPEAKVMSFTIRRPAKAREAQKWTAGGDAKGFVCTECGKTLSCKSSLNKHKLIHSGTKPFRCDKCGKRFVQSGHLRRHLQTHSGIKPFPCPQCGRFFSDKSTMKEHLKWHTGKDLLECKECKKKFRYRSSLRTHQRIHSGIRPYGCHFCGKEFFQKTNLQAHMKTHVYVKKPDASTGTSMPPSNLLGTSIGIPTRGANYSHSGEAINLQREAINLQSEAINLQDEAMDLQGSLHGRPGNSHEYVNLSDTGKMPVAQVLMANGRRGNLFTQMGMNNGKLRMDRTPVTYPMERSQPVLRMDRNLSLHRDAPRRQMPLNRGSFDGSRSLMGNEREISLMRNERERSLMRNERERVLVEERNMVMGMDREVRYDADAERLTNRNGHGIMNAEMVHFPGRYRRY